LGLDPRNQFDQFRDLPQGTYGLRKMGEQLRKQGSHLFLCYNPWDESTRNEGHMAGLGQLIRETMADGVVLDTRGASSKELQDAADNVKKGVVMYSEGMAVPADMPGIVSGRVHNALYYVPMLNLNKLVQPSFAIFRVAELYKEPIQREFATSFFNGYGTELNVFAPGQPDWVEDQYRYLGKTTRILRENSTVFTEGKLTPLINIPMDSIWVNRWEQNCKTLYTVYSIRPQGLKSACLPIVPNKGFHFVDLWHHKILSPVEANGKNWVELETDAFHEKWLGTNNEGAVDCIAELPELIQLQLRGDLLKVQCKGGDSLKIWAGDPDYSKIPLVLKSGQYELKLSKFFGRFEGDFIVQLFGNGSLLDENKVLITPGTPRKISETPVLKPGNQTHWKHELVTIPAGRFVFKETHGDDFIPYPTELVGDTLFMPSFKMGKYPVTNQQFREFILATHYKPIDAQNFLKHWKEGKIPKGEESYPVVYVSLSDAQAYAKWKGMRLPTEQEWQYAAQTEALNTWPWQGEGDSTLCNQGNGKPDPVGAYPKGANQNGLQDLVGSVWQLTNDEYQSGSYRYVHLKGGSYFKPSSSWWYVQGGPKELNYRQFLLRVSDGFERNATVGFRLMSPW
jgi:formylglycine-generating enzyme required for sulfatase activity